MTDRKQGITVKGAGSVREACMMILLQYDFELLEKKTDKGVTVTWRLTRKQPCEVQGE